MTDKRKILLIDDEHDLVEMVREILTNCGYEVIAAYNGEEGLQKLESVSPDLIILDMNMPKMGGIAFYDCIYNQLEGKSRYPVLVLTARANLEQLFKDLNVDGFMTKPFEIDDLVNEVEMIIVKRSGGKPVARPVAAAKRKQKKILLIEDDATISGRLATAFVNADYIVDAAKSGASAFEMIVDGQPDLVLIKLGLVDIPGDVLAGKLKRIPKTSGIPMILYSGAVNLAVLRRLCEKTGLEGFVESSEPCILLKEAETLLARK